MSRNANLMSALIFEQLISHAADRGVAIPPGKRRLFLSESEYDALTTSKRIKHFTIGRHQAAALLETSGGDILAICGFQALDFSSLSHIQEIEVSPGLALAAIVDLRVKPVARSSQILNFVAAGSEKDANYTGHEVCEALALFPSLRLMRSDARAGGGEDFLANLLALCAVEGADGNGWIDGLLANELVRLANQYVPELPYEFLIRAALELDPRNLFLALYRCLEATYAFTRASALCLNLGITEKPWFEVAEALGDSLGWYPRHDQSLNAILSLPVVSRSDLEALSSILGRGKSSEVASGVADGIRDIRNSLVHYGPTTRRVPERDDWNPLCAILARIVGSIFGHAYGGVNSVVK